MDRIQRLAVAVLSLGLAAMAASPHAARAADTYDLNVILSRGVWQLFKLSLVQYHKTQDKQALNINDIGRCASCHQPIELTADQPGTS